MQLQLVVLYDELGKWLTSVNSKCLQLHRADTLALGRCLHVSYSYLEVLTSKSFYVQFPFLYLVCLIGVREIPRHEAQSKGTSIHTHCHCSLTLCKIATTQNICLGSTFEIRWYTPFTFCVQYVCMRALCLKSFPIPMQ